MRTLVVPKMHPTRPLRLLTSNRKTQIALEYAYRCKDQCHVFWLHANSHEKFREGYKKISRRVAIPHLAAEAKDDEVLAKVREWFESAGSCDWILILDNADDTGSNRIISRFIPQGSKGTVIITTRSRLGTTQNLSCEALEVGEMNVKDAKQLFHQRCGTKFSVSQDDETVLKLLKQLEYLPLGIIGATAFMLQTDTSPSEYLAVFDSDREQRIELLTHKFSDIHRENLEGGRGDDMRESILGTYFITFEQIKKEMPLAADFLRLIACLDCQNIPETVFLQLSGAKNNTVKFHEAIGKLLDFSLVTRSEGRTKYEVHRLVQLSTEAYLAGEELKRWKATAINVILNLFPEKPDLHENRGACAAYLPHAIAVTRDLEDDVDSLTVYTRLGVFLWMKGDYSRLPEMAPRALEGRTRLLGPDHHDTLESLHNLAYLFGLQGNYSEAEKLHRQVVQGREKVLGKDHPDTLTSVHNLGRILRFRGDLGQAEKLQRQALEGRKRVLGIHHADVFITLNHLALVFSDKGDYRQAEETLREALKGKEESDLGPDHPSTLNTVWWLANLLKKTGRDVEAKEALRRVADGFLSALGPQHPDTIRCRKELEEMIGADQRITEA